MRIVENNISREGNYFGNEVCSIKGGILYFVFVFFRIAENNISREGNYFGNEVCSIKG